MAIWEKLASTCMDLLPVGMSALSKLLLGVLGTGVSCRVKALLGLKFTGATSYHAGRGLNSANCASYTKAALNGGIRPFTVL